MPNIDIRVSKKVEAAVRNTLQLEIGNNVSIIPGKTIDNTVICIDDNCSMYKHGKPIEGVFVDIRLFKSSPDENKKAFVEKLFAIIEDILKIPPQYVQINYIEMPVWAANGSYLQ